MTREVIGLPSAESLRHPNQPPLLYQMDRSWIANVYAGPQWLGDYPPLPKNKDYSFLGKRIISPIECAAGPAGGRKWTAFALRMGFGIVNQKTMRTIAWEANQLPNITLVEETDLVDEQNMPDHLLGSFDLKDAGRYLNMGNSFGNPSFPVIDWTNDFRQQLKDVGDGQILAMSVTPSIRDNPLCKELFGRDSEVDLAIEAANDLVHGAVAAAVAGATMEEMNVSCNNVVQHPQEGQMYMNAPLVGYAVRSFKEISPGVDIGIKCGPFRSADQTTRTIDACQGELNFISLINTFPARVVNPEGVAVMPGREQIGFSGPAIQDVALRNVEWAAKARDSLGISLGIKGGGGVNTPEDVDRFINAGADVVFVANRFLRDPLFAYEYYLYKH